MSFQSPRRAFRGATGPVPVVTSTGPAKLRAGVKTGFMPRHPGFHRAYNAVVSFGVILVFLPLMSVIALALLLTQGPRILYRGPRIGQNGAPFNILKFRTLDDKKAARLTASQVLPAGSNIETLLGRFLRASRLDELPQLFNVLRGDMNLVGPRPVRDAIARIERARIPDYDSRFKVKPGLVGHSQAYMTHGTTKKIRARYNNMLVNAPVHYGHELSLFAKVGFSVLYRAVQETMLRLRGTRPDHIAATRAARLDLHIMDPQSGIAQPLAALDAGTLVLSRPMHLPFRDDLRLEINLGGGRVRTARLSLHALDETGARFAYDCRTPAGQYIVERYVLDLAVVGPIKPDRPRKAGHRLSLRLAAQPVHSV